MFKDNLISLRKLNHLSQEELAEKLGISRQTLSKYETGESVPDIEKCKAIADYFEVSLDDLVYYSEKETGLLVPPESVKLVNQISGVYPINTGCNTVLFPISVFTQWVKIKAYKILMFSMFFVPHIV